MLYMRCLLYFIVLHSISTWPQINLYHTDLTNENEHNTLQHNCLRVIASREESDVSRQIISYCISESPLNFHIDKDDSSPKFTFAELSKRKVTSEQLYIWSAPIDIVERYQFYLNQLSTSSDDLLTTTETFYNCTRLKFGSRCEYEFAFYHADHSSLNGVIHQFYDTHEYNPVELTCYTHLQCDRGSYSACLDWSEICDRKVDCLDNQSDEEYCWQLEMNQCNDDEFRCTNGQCIPQSFYHDDIHLSDCLDGSDEYGKYGEIYYQCQTNEVSFRCEDRTCRYSSFLTSSCVKRRHELLLEAMFSFKNDSISDHCWSAIRCVFRITNRIDSTCMNICQENQCVDIIMQSCPDVVYIPAVPVIFGDVYFAHRKEDLYVHRGWALWFPYVCYNNSRYDAYFVNGSKMLFKNTICYKNGHETYMSFSAHVGKLWDQLYLSYFSDRLWKYNHIYNYTSAYCNRSNMYPCLNSIICISIHRLNDATKDCPYGDDESVTNMDDIVQAEELIGISSTYEAELKLKLRYVRRNISFQNICDGFTELLPITIEGRNETDETQCEQWPCNNIYTRCNGLWNCLNGADEVDCGSSPPVNCSSDHRLCVAPRTNQLMCLPVQRVNDGLVDCLGATDEPRLCRTDYRLEQFHNFYCTNDNDTTCIGTFYLCNRYKNCYHGDDEQFCEENRTVSNWYDFCDEHYSSSHSDVEKFVCENMITKKKEPMTYFALDGMSKSVETLEKTTRNTMSSSSSIVQKSSQFLPHCDRGLDLLVRSNNATMIVCLCPPNFSGNKCQYQNQRVSLAIKFRALSDSWQTLFAILVSLIDDSNERIIHSYEQFTYLSVRDCKLKYNIYLLYSTRPKNSTKRYAIQFDIYEKISLIYRGSLLFPIGFSFLPVHRLAFIIDIPRNDDKEQTSAKYSCVHGKCMRYSNNQEHASFCQCNPGWSGQYCTMPYSCMCSLDSLCIGVSAHGRSICICPIHKFGSRCLLTNTVCQINNTSLCQNGGRCIPTDEYMASKQTFTCICAKGFIDDRCEIADNQLILSFDDGVALNQVIFIHFIEIMNNGPPVRATTFRTILIKEDSVTIYWSRPFHLVFIQLPNKDYYLPIVQTNYTRSTTIIKMIKPSDRCPHISEVFTKTFARLHLLRRIKYYHLACQNSFSNLACFHDDTHLCLCYNYEHQRLANCFEFNHNMTFDCLGQNECENDGQCFQDAPDCPQRSICLCPPCFYGTRCQFNTNGLGLSLDAILGYHIVPDVSLRYQPSIVQISVVLTIIFTVAGLINGVLAVLTFKSKIIREVGCGLYLFGASITALLTMIIFAWKVSILVLTQVAFISNRSFLSFQCGSTDFVLRVCLSMDQWLSACVALERAVTTKQGTTFSRKKSKQAAKFVILGLLIIIIGTSIREPLYRRLIVEENDHNQKRIWCVVTYTPNIRLYNSIMYVFHFFGPCLINLVSAIILITNKSRQQANLQVHRTYIELVRQQLREHKHLFTAPVLLVILALPRLIICFVSKCMKSSNDAWLFLLGYFISFIPPTLTFVIFILPSKFYKRHFRNSVAPYQIAIQRRLQMLS